MIDSHVVTILAFTPMIVAYIWSIGYLFIHQDHGVFSDIAVFVNVGGAILLLAFTFFFGMRLFFT